MDMQDLETKLMNSVDVTLPSKSAEEIYQEDLTKYSKRTSIDLRNMSDSPLVVDDDADRYIDGMLRSKTNEQKMQSVANNVFAGFAQTDQIDIDLEDSDENNSGYKQQLVEEINNIRSVLSRDFDLSNIKEVDENSPINEIKLVYQRLSVKNTMYLNENIAESLFVFIAELIERLFDGETDYLGYKPDLKGWSTTVRAKMRKYKPITGPYVTKLSHDFGLTPATQIGIDLLLSAASYASARNEAKEEQRIAESMHNMNQHTSARTK